MVTFVSVCEHKKIDTVIHINLRFSLFGFDMYDRKENEAQSNINFHPNFYCITKQNGVVFERLNVKYKALLLF